MKKTISRSVLIENNHGWNHKNKYGLSIHSIGNKTSLKEIVDFFDLGIPMDRQLIRKLSSLAGCYSFVIESEKWIIAAVDKIRGYPLFYLHNNNEIFFSNNPRLFSQDLIKNNIDSNALLDFEVAGYVTGSDTLLSKIKQIQSGEIVFWDKSLPLTPSTIAIAA